MPYDPSFPATGTPAASEGTRVRFTFGISRGQDGQQGPEGPKGPLGEVTSQQLADAIAGTANNTNPSTSRSATRRRKAKCSRCWQR